MKLAEVSQFIEGQLGCLLWQNDQLEDSEMSEVDERQNAVSLVKKRVEQLQLAETSPIYLL